MLSRHEFVSVFKGVLFPRTQNTNITSSETQFGFSAEHFECTQLEFYYIGFKAGVHYKSLTVENSLPDRKRFVRMSRIAKED